MPAITQYPDIHTEAGARWLAPFALIVLATLIGALLMVVYPHLTA